MAGPLTESVGGGLVLHFDHDDSATAHDTVTTYAHADPSVWTAADLTVQVATTTDPFATSPSWYPLTAYVDSITISRGASIEAGLQPGSCTIHIDDPERVVETAGHLEPSRRIQVHLLGVQLFDGFLDTPARGYGHGRTIGQRVTAYDLATVIAEDSVTGIADGVGAGESTGERIGRILDETGVPVGLRDIDTGLSTCAAHDESSASALAEIQRVNQTELGRFFVSAAGLATFRERYAAVGSVALDINDTGAGDTIPGGISVARPTNRIVTVAEVEWSQGITQVVDTSAVTLHRRRRRTYQTFIDNARIAESLGEWQLHQHSTPRDLIDEVSVGPVTSRTALTELVGVELGDRVSVTKTPLDGSALTFDTAVDAITWTLAGMAAHVTFRLAPQVGEDVWTWGDEWDDSTPLVWGY